MEFTLLVRMSNEARIPACDPDANSKKKMIESEALQVLVVPDLRTRSTRNLRFPSSGFQFRGRGRRLTTSTELLTRKDRPRILQRLSL